MSWLFTSRRMLGMWLIRLALHMLPSPCWAIGAIVLPMPSERKLAGLTIEVAPGGEYLKALSVVSSVVCELLSCMARGKEYSTDLQLYGYRPDQARESDGSADAKSLH